MSDIRKEALLNEYKGNLYEFIFAHLIARHFDCELSFLNSLNNDLKQMLEQQERFIREFYPHLLNDLPELAHSLVDTVTIKLDIKKINNVEIIGKVALASHDKTYAESDVLLVNDQQKYFLSLKLGKAQSFLNTKSAGIKSFFSTYFSFNQQAGDIQKSFNNVYDEKYQEFAIKMHQLAEIEYSSGFQSWIENGLDELPGSLTNEFKQCYREFTHFIAKELFNHIRTLYNFDAIHFTTSLYPLMGFSDTNVIQASTYYKNDNDNYILDKNRVDTFNNKLVLKNIVIKDNVNYCDIVFEDRILQIRLKAMNKSTHSSFKVNCSVKYLD